MMDHRIELMKNGKINKAVNYMMLPAVVGLMINGLYNFVDTMFVAWLGTYATSATQVVMPIMLLISSFGLCLGVGGGSYVSRLLGKSQGEKANIVGTVAFFTAVCIGLAFTAVAIVFIEPILSFFGAEPDSMTLAKTYGKYIILAAPFSISSITLNNLLRAEGSARLSMIGMASGAVLNVILDPIFIFVLGMGVEGAAIATMISRMVTFLILISRYLSHKSVLRLNIKYLKPTLSIYIEIMRIGVSTFFKQVLYSLSMAVMNRMAVSYGGQELLAAAGILVRITVLQSFILFGVGQGMQPVVGYNYGAGNWQRVRAAFRYSLLISMAVATFGAFIMIVFGRTVIDVFRPAEQVMFYGIIGIKFYGIAGILMALTNIVTSFYQALGKGLSSLLLSVSRQGVLFIPALYLLPMSFGPVGILGAQLVADILTTILTVLLFAPYIKPILFDKDYEPKWSYRRNDAQENSV